MLLFTTLSLSFYLHIDASSANQTQFGFINSTREGKANLFEALRRQAIAAFLKGRNPELSSSAVNKPKPVIVTQVLTQMTTNLRR